MKISIIGAGNVGSLTAMRIAAEFSGEIVLVDIAKGLAQGKALDLSDAQAIIKADYNIIGSEDLEEIKDSGLVVITAGLTRKPGMLREELLAKNYAIVRECCLAIKHLAPKSVVIVVTNPLDLMTYVAFKALGNPREKVLGMGVTLDSARFANLIAQELNIPVTEIEAPVIGVHGEGMLPLERFTIIKGLPLEQFLDEKKIKELVIKTIGRGGEIVSLLGSGSAFFAPSAAVAAMARAIIKNELRVLGISAYLQGEYGVNDVCLGVPCRLGKDGIEQIIELDLAQEEKDIFIKAAHSIKEQINKLCHTT